MKKHCTQYKFFIMAILIATLLGTQAFAVKPQSDLQFQIGVEGLWGHGNNGSGWDDNDADACAFNIMIENYNMFPLPVGGGDFLSIGFMESFYGSFGGVTDWNGHGTGDFDTSKALGFGFDISPAFGIKFGDIVKLQMILGIAFRYQEFGVKWDHDWGEGVARMATLGVTTGCQAKFFPSKFLSPVAGIRYTWTGMPEYYWNGDYESEGDDDKVSHSCHINNFLFSIGLSLNFGNK